MNEDHGHIQHGKWSQAGVPHRGWSWVGSEDLEEDRRICEMCESVEIRFVHFMEHPDYPETLRVGCVCAEHMSGDYVGPKQKEKVLKAAVRSRKRWAKMAWQQSAKGNSYVNKDGFNITVSHIAPGFLGPGGWRLRLINQTTRKTQLGHKIYPTKEAAQLGSFDALLWAKANL